MMLISFTCVLWESVATAGVFAPAKEREKGRWGRGKGWDGGGGGVEWGSVEEGGRGQFEFLREVGGGLEWGGG